MDLEIEQNPLTSNMNTIDRNILSIMFLLGNGTEEIAPEFLEPHVKNILNELPDSVGGLYFAGVVAIRDGFNYDTNSELWTEENLLEYFNK